MTEAQDATGQGAEPPACPQCGKAEHVQKLSAIRGLPAECRPPDRPSEFDAVGVVSVVGSLLLRSGPPLGWARERHLSKFRQGARWDKGMRLWERLYLCPRDEVAFIPGAASVIPLREIRDSFYALGDRLPFAPWSERSADFSPMPEEFADFERMLEEAKVKRGTLICFDCGYYNPVGQSQCEMCDAWVPQTARARWTYGK